MMRYYSRSTGSTYITGVHAVIPSDAVPITDEVFLTVFSRPWANKILSHDERGIPVLIERPIKPLTAEELCAGIDRAADMARQTAAGDPLRALEYNKAFADAVAFKADGYPAANVPETVSAWAVAGRTPEQAAVEIIAKAMAFDSQLLAIRTIRLKAKESVRTLIAENEAAAAEMTAQVAINNLRGLVSETSPRED
ncbi:phage tail protein [Pseudomonas fontis]|uniref:Phage tail protein n=1 Tax=Pseudomonas fontis TaxID=2942633 RepID=A0ABT5NXJ6_9PSED|nr:phage tail protein [Pseudomonas fontis]MDD0973792.1 phage tail protein [Pseudomonas fontis]MDD0992926.1 phage tail protein [Pseudomonas fontis]